MIVKGGVPIRRIPKASSVSIQAGQRVFHKRADGAYEPASITLKAEVQNVINPAYRWGRIYNGAFQPLGAYLSALTIRPVHSGVLVVRVTGDNVPNYIEDHTTVTVVEDGAPAVQYRIVVKQISDIVTAIPCDSAGNPKLYYQATAYLYKVTGNTEEPCADYQCVIAYQKGGEIVNSAISETPTSSFTFNVDGNYDSVRIGFSDGDNVITDVTIPKMYDGSTGSNGYTYRSRGMFTNGESYVWDDMYRDVIYSWFNNKLYTFRVKNKGASVTVRPTSSNGDANWESASDMKFAATDLLLAQDAIVNVLGTSEIFVGELDKTEGWKMTKGAIRHSGTGLELTKDGRLSAPVNGVTIGTKSVEEMLGGIQIGGRNYAHGTSSEWSESVTLANIANQTFPLYDCHLTDVRAGDTVCFSFDLEYANIVKNPNAILQLQAPGSDTGWGSGGISIDILPFVSASSGMARIVRFHAVTDYQLRNRYWPLGIRCDNMSGSVRYKNFKFEIGTRATGWSPAPEDYVETGIDIQNRKIVLKADTTVFQNNAGEDIAIFQDNKIKASLIDVDNLVARKVETSSEGKRITISPSDNRLTVYDSTGRKVIEISFIDGTGNISPFPRIAAYGYDSNGNIQNTTSMIYGGVTCINYINGVVNAQTNIGPLGIYVSSDSFNQSFLSRDGLRIFKNGSLYKSYT